MLLTGQVLMASWAASVAAELERLMALCHIGSVRCRGVEGLYTRLDIPNVAQPALLVVTLDAVSMVIGQVKRMETSKCITEGCVHMAGPGHISCCSLCKRTGGQQHTIQCAHRQARHVQRARPNLQPTTGGMMMGAPLDDSTRVCITYP